MKVQIYLLLDSDYNTLDLPKMEVKDEQEIKDIARKAWTRDQIRKGSVEYFYEDHKLPGVVTMEEHDY